MYEKILIAYDSSARSHRAIENAKLFTEQNGDIEIHIISIMESTGPTTNVNISRSILKELKEKFQPQMDEIKQELEKENVKVITTLLMEEDRRNPGKIICNYAEEHDIDLIIVGSRGLGNIRKLFLGSVSNHIVQHATCPVLVIK